MDLERALEEFDAVETNLRRLEKVWEEMQQLIPDSVAFLGNSPEALRYSELQRSYALILKGIPPVGAYSIKAVPGEDIDGIAQARLDAMEIGEFEAKLWVEEKIDEPTREIHEYRSRFRKARLELVRDKLQELIPTINRLVSALVERVPNSREPVEGDDWAELVAAFGQVVRLAGSQIPQAGRWRDMRRHVHFAQGRDVHDIAKLDWPSVRSDLETSLYSELEPVPVGIENLVTLVQAKPTGPVTTRLTWEAISAEEFERLLFNLISDAEEYVNPQWLMQTNASDRGRDLSVDRVITDALSGTQRQRVIIQAKHWTKKSVRPSDVTETLTEISLWEPPVIQSLIIATSGRFTADAVVLIEKHNNEGKRPQIEMWAESHLELLLARRPHLVSGFNLRP
jgi:Restriction endonuclease